MKEVGHLIHRDVYEKKLRQAMAQEYHRMTSSATIDNLIAGTVQSPTLNKGVKGAKGVEPAGGAPASAAGAVQAQYQQPVQQR